MPSGARIVGHISERAPGDSSETSLRQCIRHPNNGAALPEQTRDERHRHRLSLRQRLFVVERSGDPARVAVRENPLYGSAVFVRYARVFEMR